MFGFCVEGFELIDSFVTYATSRAKLLNLQDKTKFFRQNICNYTFQKKYDVISYLGFNSSLFGGMSAALNYLKSNLKTGGILIFAEPVWLKKSVLPKVFSILGVMEETFLSKRDETVITGIKFC